MRAVRIDVYVKKYNFFKKVLAKRTFCMYTIQCCDMIAEKREVAGCQQWQSGFPWSECQVKKLTTSHCTVRKSARSRNDVLKN